MSTYYRWNTSTHIFERDTSGAQDGSGPWVPLELNASILNEGGIVNSQISASAAIAYSKLNLANSILNADINSAAAIAYSKLNLALGIVNGDINAAAAIAWSKISKTSSSLADLATRSAGDLSSGTLPHARVPDKSTWSVAWTSTGTAPAIGNGSMTGNYIKIGKLVLFEMKWVAGSTTTYGTGTYRFNLPTTSAFSSISVGSGHLLDSGSLRRILVARLVSTTTFEIYFDNNLAGIDKDNPVTLTTNDEILINGHYLET